MDARVTGGEAIELNVYGFRVQINGTARQVIHWLALDYAWFVTAPTSSPPDLEITVDDSAPNLDPFEDAVAVSIGPRTVAFRSGELQVTDYGSGAATIYNPRTKHLRVECKTDATAHEAVYMFVNQKVTHHIERAGFIRMHALALVGPCGAVAVTLPSGGGKTTLALRALEDGVKILSEDAPLLDRAGLVYPFPLRIGLDASEAPTSTDSELRQIEMMQMRPKVAIEIDSFRDQIEDGPLPLHDLIIGRRSLALDATLTRIPNKGATTMMFRENVVGAGLYQGLRFVQESSWKARANKLKAVASRASICVTAVKRARVWELRLGRDQERNWEALRPLVEDHR